MTSLKHRYIRNNNCEFVQLDGEWIILNTETFTVTKLNEIGGFCWLLLGRSQSISSMVESIQNKYVLAADTAEQDLQAFLSDMMECGLVHDAV